MAYLPPATSPAASFVAEFVERRCAPAPVPATSIEMAPTDLRWLLGYNLALSLAATGDLALRALDRYRQDHPPAAAPVFEGPPTLRQTCLARLARAAAHTPPGRLPLLPARLPPGLRQALAEPHWQAFHAQLDDMLP